MKKSIFTLLLLVSGILATSAQTTATNFTATDCNGNAHTLFTDLDAGKIVVLVWVMPCGSCISDAKAAYDAVQTFATSNPGKVLYYIADDYGNSNCTSLTSWANSYGIGATNRVIFSNSGTTIDEANYGGSGMPHVVVMGGTNHKIYFNALNGSNNGTAIRNAIQQAIGATTGINQSTTADGKIKVYPNPASDNITLSYSLSNAGEVNVEIVDLNGKVVKSISENQTPGQHEVNVPLGKSLVPGYYVLKLHAAGTTQVAGFTIAR